MPRSIEFEVEPVLDAVTEEFRRSGFGGTSIKMLERATGLSSGSLHNSFGDKDAIFQKALAHYTDTVVAGRLDEHLSRNPPLEGLRSLFLSLFDEPGGGSNGCLLTNTAIEFGSELSDVNSGVQKAFQLQLDAFLAAVEGISPGTTNAPQIALKLLAFYQGVLVLVRSGYPKDVLRLMIISEIETLRGTKA